MQKTLLLFMLLSSYLLSIELGSIPPKVSISGEDGAKTDGSAWNSTMLKGEVHILFYVDPDERDLNNEFTERLKKRSFDKQKLKSVAVINLAATWLPNVLLETMLEEKQKEYPDTVYVKDKTKVLVKEWNLADDNSDVLLFDKQGKLIYKKFGKLDNSEIEEVLQLIEKTL